MSLYDVATAFGNWQTAAIWSLGVSPTSSQDAYIGGAGGFRVTSNSAVTVNSVGVAANDQLEIGAGSTLTATDGTTLDPNDSAPASGIAGFVYVDVRSTFSIGDAVVNIGTINLGSTGVGGGLTPGDLALNGAVAISGDGVIDLGGITGSASNETFYQGEITGGGLTNYGNTVVGAGFITVGTLNNVEGAIVAQQALGDWLVVSATTFTNDASLEIEQQATMDLGADGATRLLSNNGIIVIGYNGGVSGAGADATLVISGDFTINGPGSIVLAANGAAIVGDTSDSSVFTNGAASSIHASASGQIGNGAGVAPSFSLAFTNDGDVVASGVGVTLTINTGSNTVYDPGGLLEAAGNATLVLMSPVQMGQYYSPVVSPTPPPGGTIEATTGGTVEIVSTLANGPPSQVLAIHESSGQVVADAGSTVFVTGIGVVAVPLQIEGASGGMSGGVVNLGDGGAITGTVSFVGAGGTLSLREPLGAVNVSGNGGTVNLSFGQVNVSGGADTLNFTSATDVANLSNTGGVWDNVNGSNGAVNLSDAWSGVVGGSDTVTFVTGTDNIASLWNTGGFWDNVNGSNGTVLLNNAISGVVGGDDTVDFTYGSGDIASLWNTGAAWDNVNGSNGTVLLNNAISGVVGGGDTVDFNYGSGDIASLWNTGAAWDNVNGSNGTVLLNNAISGVVGGGATVDFNYGSGDIASLWNTGAAWDNVNGSNGTVLLNNAISGVVGGGDTIDFNFGSGNAASLWNTNGTSDTVNNIGGVTGVIYVNNAQANINGNGDVVDFSYAGSDSVTVSGTSETFVLQPLTGTAQITGYDALTDQIDLSSAQFGTNWTTFFHNDVLQPTANTTVIVDPNNSANKLTLVGVSASSLNMSNFHFG